MNPLVRRRAGWAALAVAVAATVAVVPPLLLPAPAPDPGSAALFPAAPSSPVATASPATFAISRHAADGANLRNGARIIDCPSCDGGRRVGYIGGPNTLAIRVAGVPSAGERTLLVVYETQDPRTLKIAVGDGPVHTMSVFVPAGVSWIRFFNDAGPAPDINRIELR
jgi:hypothetical protein